MSLSHEFTVRLHLVAFSRILYVLHVQAWVNSNFTKALDYALVMRTIIGKMKLLNAIAIPKI